MSAGLNDRSCSPTEKGKSQDDSRKRFFFARPAALSFEPRDGSGHPLRHLHLRWVGNLSAHFRYVRRSHEPRTCDVSQFPMNRAGEVHCLLAEYDASSSVSEMPIEDRQAALESMCLAIRIDDELQ